MRRKLTPEEQTHLMELVHTKTKDEVIDYLRKLGYSEEEIKEILRELYPTKKRPLPFPNLSPTPSSEDEPEF